MKKHDWKAEFQAISAGSTSPADFGEIKLADLAENASSDLKAGLARIGVTPKQALVAVAAAVGGYLVFSAIRPAAPAFAPYHRRLAQ
jgi:hypothetical protein